MAPSLTERAQKARNALFVRYDELNALWLEAEQQLTKLHVPHGVECSYASWQSERDPQIEEYACLGVQRMNGKWRICYGESDCFHPHVVAWTPITDCSIGIRTGAAHHLPKLREAVVAAAERFIPRVDSAIGKLRSDLKSCTDEALKAMFDERSKLGDDRPGH